MGFERGVKEAIYVKQPPLNRGDRHKRLTVQSYHPTGSLTLTCDPNNPFQALKEQFEYFFKVVLIQNFMCISSSLPAAA